MGKGERNYIFGGFVFGSKKGSVHSNNFICSNPKIIDEFLKYRRKNFVTILLLIWLTYPYFGKINYNFIEFFHIIQFTFWMIVNQSKNIKK